VADDGRTHAVLLRSGKLEHVLAGRSIPVDEADLLGSVVLKICSDVPLFGARREGR
jgi:hypothetical protein